MGLAPLEDDDAPVVPEEHVLPPNTAYDQPMARALVESPDDQAAFERYGRWLAEQNDPRGPVILRMLAGEDASEAFDRFPGHFLGPLEEAKGVELDWRWGFWGRVRLSDPWGDDIVALLKSVLDHPSALVLQELELHTGRMEPVADLLGDGEVLSLRKLVVDAEGSLLGAWTAVWPRVPDVEEVVLLGANPQIGAMSLPKLRRLEIRGTLSDDALADLRRAHLPALEELIVPRPDLLTDTFGDRVSGG